MEVLDLVMFVITVFAAMLNSVIMFMMAFEEKDFETAFWQLFAEAYLVLAAIALGRAPFPK